MPVTTSRALGWALITGASGGLGQGYAERLAADGFSLVLVARQEDVLRVLASDLEKRHGTKVLVLPCDLADAQARSALVADIEARGLEISMLVNNAGFASIGPFVDLDAARLADEISVNVAALTHLARAFAPAMVARRDGAIINIASTAAFQPLPGMAVYAATKAYVLSFSRALWEEFRGSGVKVLAVCPGATQTGFFTAAGAEDVLTRRRTTPQVIATTFIALAKGQPSVIDGAQNAVLAHVARLAPMRIALPVAKAFLRR